MKICQTCLTELFRQGKALRNSDHFGTNVVHYQIGDCKSCGHENCAVVNRDDVTEPVKKKDVFNWTPPLAGHGLLYSGRVALAKKFQEWRTQCMPIACADASENFIAFLQCHNLLDETACRKFLGPPVQEPEKIQAKTLPNNLIYTCELGRDPMWASRKAVELGCDRFIHNDKIYRVTFDYSETGETISK